MLGRCKAGKFLSFHLLGTGKNEIVRRAVAHQSGGLFDFFFFKQVCIFPLLMNENILLSGEFLKRHRNLKSLDREMVTDSILCFFRMCFLNSLKICVWQNRCVCVSTRKMCLWQFPWMEGILLYYFCCLWGPVCRKHSL